MMRGGKAAETEESGLSKGAQAGGRGIGSTDPVFKVVEGVPPDVGKPG